MKTRAGFWLGFIPYFNSSSFTVFSFLVRREAIRSPTHTVLAAQGAAAELVFDLIASLQERAYVH
jgi:hypothetical protein